MRVKVRAYATIREVVGSNVEVELPEDAEVGDLLNELAGSHGKSFSEKNLNEGG